MATRIIYTYEGSGYVQSQDTVYLTARSGGTLSLPAPVGHVVAGQLGTSPFQCYEGFVSFYTNGLSGISSATLAMFVFNDGSTTDFTITASLQTWYNGSGSLTTADYIPGANLSALTQVASLTSAGLSTVAYNSFVDTAMVANINTSGYTEMVVFSSREAAGTSPTGNEWTDFYGAGEGITPVKLTIIDSSTQNSQTLAGGTTSFSPAITGLHDLDMWAGGGRPPLAANQEGGAGGGAYTFAQYIVSSLSSVTVQVGDTQSTANTAGNDSWFGSSSAPDPLAKGGAAAQTGGVGADGRGSVRFNGGNGAAAQGGGGSRGGSGGGSGAGTAAVGGNGAAGSGSSGGAGGTAPASGGGNGGNGGNSGVGGGTGTVPGGGAGGGGNGADAGNGAAGRIIVYWYTTPSQAESIYDNPVRNPSSFVSVNAQQWVAERAIYLPTPPPQSPFFQTDYPNPLRPNGLVGINANEWLQPTNFLLFFPKIASVYDNPVLGRNPLVGINAQEWTTPSPVIPFTPPVVSTYDNPVRGKNPLVGINAQEWISTSSPVLPFTPDVGSIYENPTLGRNPLVGISAQGWLVHANTLPFTPPVVRVYDNPVRGLSSVAALNAQQWVVSATVLLPYIPELTQIWDNPVKGSNPLVSTNAQQWVSNNTILQPVLTPEVQSFFDIPLQRAPIVGVRSQEWVANNTIFQPIVSPEVQSVFELPTQRSHPWVAINSQIFVHGVTPGSAVPTVGTTSPNPAFVSSLVAINAQSWASTNSLVFVTGGEPVGSIIGNDNPLIGLSSLIAINAQQWATNGTIVQPVTPPDVGTPEYVFFARRRMRM